MPLDPLNDPLLRAPRSHASTIAGMTEAANTATPEQLADFVDAIGASGGGGGGGHTPTDLGATATPTGVTVTSSTGADALLPLATATNAGLMAPAQHAKLADLPTAAALATDQAAQDLEISGKASATHTHTPAAIGAATTAQGAKADSALQPGVLPVGTTLPAAQISNATTPGRALLTAADAAAQRTALALGNVSNTADADKPVSTAQQTALDGKMAATLPALQTVFDTGTAPQKAAFQASVSGYALREIPAALGWDSVSYPVQVYSAEPGNGYTTGWHPRTSAQYLACAAGPAYYVSPTGVDSTGTGTIGAPWRTIWKAQQAINAGGVPGRIMIAAGIYNKDANFTVGIGSNQPLIDTMYVAYGGVVTIGAHAAVTFTADATFTNTSSASRAATARVFDLRERDRQTGLYRELVKVADAATCNKAPWSWALVGSTLYVNRGDGLLAADSNTRVFLSVTNAVAQTAVSLFYIGETSTDQMILEGGTAGCIVVSYSATTGKRIFYCENVAARYAGTYGDTSLANGFGPNSVRGICWFENCAADGNKSDGFNWHDGNAVGECYFMTVRCSANGNGVYAGASCNGWTSHENCVAIDVGGVYQYGAGGTFHTIGTTKTFAAGTLARWSVGDRHFGGAFIPMEFRVSDTAEMWLDGCGSELLTREGVQLYASDTAKIHARSMRTGGYRIAKSSGATVDTY